MGMDESVSREIDDLIARLDCNGKDELEKRKPKPYRYLTDEREIKRLLELEEKNYYSVMNNSKKPLIVNDYLSVSGLGDTQTIEKVIRKHEASRKIIE